ncbi:glycosyltransferase [bacterium]|nr:glycosyltransferase [bacterium]
MMKANRRVLILAYYFPPLGMGGVQRAVKFVKYLPQFGWTPEVITVKPVHYHAMDPSLLDKIDKTIISRTGSLDPLRLLYKLKKHGSQANPANFSSASSTLYRQLSRWFCIPDDKILWTPFAIKKALDRHKAEPFDAIITTSPPHSVHLAGMAVKSQTKLPWLADFRDGWWFEPHEQLPTTLHSYLNKRLLQSIIKHIDVGITISQGLADTFQRITSREFSVIPNGFDDDDFKSINPVKDSDKFTISYCGTLTSQMNPETFLKAMEIAIDKHETMRSKIQLHWIGKSIGINLQELLESYNLKQYSQIMDYVDHHQAISYMKTSHALLFLLPPAYGPGVITGKVFEYIAAGTEILTMAREGDAMEIIRQTGRAREMSIDNPSVAADVIIELYEQWHSGKLDRGVDESTDLRKYTRKEQTRELADQLNSIIGA